MRTIKLEGLDAADYMRVHLHATSQGLTWNPHPIIGYYPAFESIWLPIRYRTVGASALGGSVWEKVNQDMVRMCGHATMDLMRIAEPNFARKESAPCFIEVTGIGGFVWTEGKHDEAALLLLEDEPTSHELMAAFDAFLQRREAVGNGMDTRIPEESGERDARPRGERRDSLKGPQA